MLDHVLALTFAIGFPVVSIPLYSRRLPLLRAGDPAARRREYLETIAWLGGMGLATLAIWVVEDRALSTLGLGVSGSWQFLVAIGIAAVVAGLLVLQVRGVRRDEHTREAAREALEHVREFLPYNPAEMGLFRGVSVSAGIGEELFYRGFLLWYLTPLLSLPWAMVLSSLLFGSAHLMHGTKAAARAALTGAGLALLYVFSGALWASMVVHTVIDLSAAEMARAAYWNRA